MENDPKDDLKTYPNVVNSYKRDSVIYCPYCGAENSITDDQCTNCGKILPEDESN